MLHKTLKK